MVASLFPSIEPRGCSVGLRLAAGYDDISTDRINEGHIGSYDDISTREINEGAIGEYDDISTPDINEGAIDRE
jgi:hypothetical protein